MLSFVGAGRRSCAASTSSSSGAGVSKFRSFVSAVLHDKMRYWLRSVTSAGNPPASSAQLAASGVDTLSAILSCHQWEDLLALQLPRDVFWPRNDMVGPLFIRDFYHRAWEDVFLDMRRRVVVGESGASTDEPCKFVVLGTPGIGKTAFTMYCLLRLLAARRPVRFQICGKRATSTAVGVDAHVNADGVVVGGSVPDSSTRDYVFIHDSVEPDDMMAHDAHGTLLVTSPDPDVWNDWHKQRCAKTTFFPTHTREELRLLAWLTDKPLALVDKGMPYFGGVPRYVLNSTAATDRKTQSMETIKGLSKEQMARISAGLLTDMPIVQHSLFYEDVDRETLTRTGLLHIPEQLVPVIMDHIFTARLVEASQLISLLDHVPAACTFAGQLFEQQVLRLMAGATFTLRQLTPPGRLRRTCGQIAALPKVSKVKFDTNLTQTKRSPFYRVVSDLFSTVGTTRMPITACAVPAAKTQAAVDFVLSNGMLCNVTLQKCHSIVAQGTSGVGLRALLSACPQLIRHNRERDCAYVNFVWWQLQSRAMEQLPGKLVFGDGCSVDGDEDSDTACAIMVGGKRVFIRQFVASVSMTAAALHDHMLSLYTPADSEPPAACGAGAAATVRSTR
ncbi:MAG: hypothetical protein EOO65_00880 [Methanosarcinales archaeon]|nr:MAG: hypothetical protein EOO65_00880 [Methanosarcinales archaeon]